MAVTKIKPIKGTLNKALDYIQNPEKTDGKMLVSSFGCSYETADIEFAFTLSQALDKIIIDMAKNLTAGKEALDGTEYHYGEFGKDVRVDDVAITKDTLKTAQDD